MYTAIWYKIVIHRLHCQIAMLCMSLRDGLVFIFPMTLLFLIYHHQNKPFSPENWVSTLRGGMHELMIFIVIAAIVRNIANV